MKYFKLKFSYSRPLFLTYKTDLELAPSTLRAIELVYARKLMLSLGRLSTPEALLEKTIPYKVDHYHYINLSFEENFTPILPPSINFNTLPKPGEMVLTMISLSSKEHWLAIHEQKKYESPYPGGISPLTLPPESPSRAYLKIAEAYEIFSDFTKGITHALDVGAAPGGSTFFLLNQGLKVTALDAGEMDKSLLSHERIKVVHKSIQSVTESDLTPFDLMTVDLNLSPYSSLKEVMRIAAFSKRSLKTLFMTLKTADKGHIPHLPSHLEPLKDFGFNEFYPIQLYSHKKEYLIAARRPI